MTFLLIIYRFKPIFISFNQSVNKTFIKKKWYFRKNFNVLNLLFLNIILGKTKFTAGFAINILWNEFFAVPNISIPIYTSSNTYIYILKHFPSILNIYKTRSASLQIPLTSTQSTGAAAAKIHPRVEPRQPCSYRAEKMPRAPNPKWVTCPIIRCSGCLSKVRIIIIIITRYVPRIEQKRF